jgi:hypothetical protein
MQIILKKVGFVFLSVGLTMMLPAYAAEQDGTDAMRSAALPSASVTQCPTVQHWDAGARMCMPDPEAANNHEIDKNNSQYNAPKSVSLGLAETPSTSSSCLPDRAMNSDMNMCMTSQSKPTTSMMFQLNQFMVYSNTSGPRGQSRLTGPGLWMLMYDADLSPKNQFRIDVMGSLEQWTVGDKGTPQLLQTEHVDNMHAHDKVMALEFRDVVKLEADGKHQLTFLFAPRGGAAIGPVPFMHRESADGNPDAPLGHARQDGFHDVSTVLGVAYKNAGTTVETTVFSGQNIRWPFPMHRPDSYGLRVNQSINDQISVGTSYADALLPDDAGGAEHNRFISAWLTTSYQRHGNSLKSSFIWGQIHPSHDTSLNSFLEEAAYQIKMNKFYGRAEILQNTPDQLELMAANGTTGSKWVKALTFGYERTLFKIDQLSLFAGGSYTKDFVPATFQDTYGSDPRGVKVYLRISVNTPFAE